MKCQVIKYGLLLMLTVFFVSACSSAPDSPLGDQNVIVKVAFKQAGFTGNVTKIVLKVNGAGFAEISEEAQLVDGEAVIELAVPFGSSRFFEMLALDNDGTIIYQGSNLADVVAGLITEVDILLTPQVPMIKVSPLFSKLAEGELGFIKVTVFNVDSIFFASFRLEYDTNIITIISVDQGNLFGELETIGIEIIEDDYVAVSYVLINDTQLPQGVDAPGIIAEIAIRGRSQGKTDLRFNIETSIFYDWQINQIPLEKRLYYEEGEVLIEQ